MRATIFLVLVLVGSFVWAQDESKTTFSLAEAQAYAVTHHLTVQNAQLEFDEARKRVQETSAIGLPQISAMADYKYYLEIPVSVVDARAFNPAAPEGETVSVEFGVNNNSIVNLTVDQLLFDGTFIVGLKAAATYKTLKEQGIRMTEIQVKDLVATSYYNVLIAEENKKIFTQNVEKLESQLHDLQQMNQAGFIEEIEVDQLDLILSDAKQRKQTIDRQVVVMYELLNFQMGRDINAELELTEDLKTIYDNYDENALLKSDIIIGNHIDFQMIETQEKLQQLNIKRNQASRLPSIGASYQLGQNSFVDPSGLTDGSSWYRNQFIGVHISMPIFTSTMNSSKVQQEKIILNRIQNNKSMLEDNLRIEVSVARMKYINALEQFRSEEKNLKVSKKIFDNTSEIQKNGLASSMDVTVSNNHYLQIQGKYITALYNILESKATLDKALNNY
ncbi:MAG TPA: hypothetical protein DCX54_03315, partial [Flavobacteriales bacterium]|nr:hypothetical protein [Flavobacteriales bacterium]